MQDEQVNAKATGGSSVSGEAEPGVGVGASMSATLMARLFAVPALIVCVLLAVAMVVVLFGASSTGQTESVGELLTRLDGGGGERTMEVMLLPRDKEYWQAAKDLSRLLALKDTYLKPEEIEPTAARMAAIFSSAEHVGSSDSAVATRSFILLAMAKLGTPSTVETIRGGLRDPSGQVRMAAARALAEMGEIPEARAQARAILPLLEDERAEVRIVACAALAGLAESGDEAVLSGISGLLDAAPEVSWNAAMALARLGSSRGKLVLMNMLSPEYWRKMSLDYDEGGNRIVRRLSEAEVSGNLAAAIEASAMLNDSELNGLIGRLREDSGVSVEVREAARAAVKSGERASWSPSGLIESRLCSGQVDAEREVR